MKTKFAMVAINTVYDEEDKYHVRRVLISYKRKKTKKIKYLNGAYIKRVDYLGTKIIAKDPYFLDENRSHRYLFDNDGYTLIKADNDWGALYALKPDIWTKRTYHAFMVTKPRPIEFKAKTEEEAIKLFNEREELR